jgi:hypothetical protein
LIQVIKAAAVLELYVFEASWWLKHLPYTAFSQIYVPKAAFSFCS